jgi:hypothetical protein
MKTGDTVWYQDEPHTILAISASGSFGFRPCGVSPPYFGLAGVASTVRTSGVENVTGKVVGDRHKEIDVYTEVEGVRVGWVSHSLCQIEYNEQELTSGAYSIGEHELVWGTGRRRRLGGSRMG